jgi:diguanylate cyclase (GGDEF)-like protein/PAS domain S-box-containing protein
MKLMDSFNDLKVRTKLMLFLLLPICTIVILSTTIIYNKWQDFHHSNHFNDYSLISIDMVDLVYELQKERGLSAGFEGSKGQRFRDELREQRKLTDKKLQSFTSRDNQYVLNIGHWNFPEDEFLNIEEKFFQLREALQKLPAVRAIVDEPEENSDSFAYFTDINRSMLRLIQYLKVLTNDAQLIRQVDTFTTLLRLQESAGQERGLFNKIIHSENVDSELSIRAKNHAAKQETLFREFYTIATPLQKAMLQERMKHKIVAKVQDFQLANASMLRRNELLSELQIIIGYGSLIHDFKNFVIRGEQSDANHFKESYAIAMTILQEFREIPDLNNVEIAHLDDLVLTFSNYQLLLDKAIMMEKKGQSIADIDESVKVDDSLAINAIHHLKQNIFRRQNIDWWGIATSRIELMKEVNNTLQRDIIYRSKELKDNAAYTLFLYSLLTVITLAVILFLARLLMNRLVGEVVNISTNMRNMTNEGKFDQLLCVTGSDEIGEMACAFNNLMIERKSADEALQESEEHIHAISMSSTIAMLVAADHNGNIVSWNPAAERTFGYSEAEILGHHLSCIMPERYRAAHEDSFQRALKTGEHSIIGRVVEYHGLKKSGEEFPIDLSHGTWTQGGKKYFSAIIHDISERKQAEEELQKLSRAVESSSAAVMMTDIDGNIEYVNPKFTEITGYTKEEVIGKNPRFLRSGETPEGIYDKLWEAITSGGEWKGEIYNRRKDGSLYWSRISISGVKDAKGDITHYIAIQDDVTHEYELSEQLSHQATHDALTGLINRFEFERRAERLLSTTKQDNTEHALCFMDLDQFKVVNDTCGHTAGDELLRQLSMVLQHEVRKRDTLARLGGDEFGILMEHCSLDHGHRVAITLQKAVQDFQFVWKEHSFKVGVSVGLVAITEAMPNLTELMKQADAACYMAKDMGRNRIHVYRSEDQSLAQRHGEMQWVARLHRALDEDRFCLYAQPIIPLDGRIDKHYELLIRMKDEKGELIPPGAFLPAAERYNLITQLDRWVIGKTFDLLKANPAFVKQIHFISINLSGQSLTDDNILNFIITQLDETGIGGNKICFEITETAAISNLISAMEFISTLKGIGCRFALDDFGSGLSSFGYLKNLPVDYLKVDGMFVKNIVDDPIDHAMVKSINEIGQVMGMQTIAEFVENDEIKGMLRAIGVNYAQGYGIGRPLAFDELLGQSSNVSEIKKLN